jgi:hypothetical protein
MLCSGIGDGPACCLFTNSMLATSSFFVSCYTEKWWKGLKEPKPNAATLNLLLHDMRSDFESYAWFYNDVLSCVVGRKHWRKHCIHATGMELATVSDEALGLLLVENSWAPWCMRSNGRDSEDVLVETFGGTLGEGDEDRVNLSWQTMTDKERKKARQVRAKYILGLTKYTTRTAGTRGTGWSEDGIRRFNVLCDTVIKNRAGDKGVFDKEYMKGKKNEGTEGGGTGVKLSAITVYCDLSD